MGAFLIGHSPRQKEKNSETWARKTQGCTISVPCDTPTTASASVPLGESSGQSQRAAGALRKTRDSLDPKSVSQVPGTGRLQHRGWNKSKSGEKLRNGNRDRGGNYRYTP